MDKQRIKKLEGISKELIWNFISEELADKDNIFWLITITKIVISSDLSYLDVWVSSIENSDKLTKALAKCNTWIQAKFNRTIQIRKLPRIRYRYDNKWEIAQKVTETINTLNIK